MDIGESFFKSWLRFRKKIAAPKDPSDGTAVALKEVADRLKYLGVLLNGNPPEIRGGTLREEAGNFLLFPDHLDLLKDRVLNIALLVYRMVFYCTAEKHAVFAPPGLSAADNLIYTAWCAGFIKKAMESEYSGIKTISDDLYSLVEETRPKVDKVKTPEDLYEVIITLRLRGCEEAPSHLPDYLQELLQPVLSAAQAPSVSELREFKKGAAQLLKDRSKIVPLPVILWGFRSDSKAEIIQSEFSEMKKSAREERAVALERTVHLKKRSEDHRDSNPIFHAFEKTESVEDYQGEENPAEGVDELTEDEEALNDLSLGYVVRTMETTKGLVKADVSEEGTEIVVASRDPHPEKRVFQYPEWDYRKRAYRPNWCTLYEAELRAGNGGAGSSAYAVKMASKNKKEAQEIRSALLRILSSRQSQNRQLDGPDIDYDALIARHADVLAGHSPAERLYLAERKALKDVAFLILLDTSLSTDGYIEGRRILDVEIESVLLLAAGFEGYLDDAVSVAFFNSRTRNDCQFGFLKRFNEPWSRLRAVSPHLEADGYTRIGPAIRHGVSALARTKAKRKFLLVVSDGKPSDYDQYEGRYGVQDVAQAVREARHQRITTFGLTVEKQPKARLAEMFGAGRFHILPRTSLLPGYMAEIFIRAIA